MYDFKQFDEDNPAVVPLQEGDDNKKAEENDKDGTPPIDTTDKKDSETNKAEVSKASDERLKQALGDIVAKFDVDYSSIKLTDAKSTIESNHVELLSTFE